VISRRTALWGTVVSLALASVGVGLLAGQAPPDRFKSEVVGRRDLSTFVQATGVFRAASIVHVGALVSGVVSGAYVEPGDAVAAGQVIAEIDATEYRLQVRRLEAVMRSAAAQRVDAARNLERQKGLLAKGFVSAAATDTSQRDFDVASETVRVAEEDLALAKMNLGRCVIRSPISGVIVTRAVAPGQSVISSFQTPDIYTVVSDFKNLELVAHFAESDIASIAPGSMATISIPAIAGATRQAAVARILNTTESRQGIVVYPVIFKLPNPELKLRPGMSAQVKMLKDRHESVVAISSRALTYGKKHAGTPTKGSPNRTVVLLDADNRLIDVSVALGVTSGGFAEVLSSSQPILGNRVVVGDLQRGEQM
jgi:HlyD family secretion protein